MVLAAPLNPPPPPSDQHDGNSTTSSYCQKHSLPLICHARAAVSPKRSKPSAFHIPNSVNSWEVWGSFHPPNPQLLKKAALSKLWQTENTRPMVTLTASHSQGGSSPAETSQEHCRGLTPYSAPCSWSRVLNLESKPCVVSSSEDGQRF